MATRAQTSAVHRPGAPRFEPDPALMRRSSGVLLHVTSLPSGDLGAEARRFVELLAHADQSCWQILPLNPVLNDGSPYSGPSAFAGNPALIDLEALARDGWVNAHELLMTSLHDEPSHVRDARRIARRRACERMIAARASADALAELRHDAQSWLPDYSLFVALSRRFATTDWTSWPLPLRIGNPTAKSEARVELAHEIEIIEREQLLFAQQWAALRTHAAQHGIRIVGDVPIFVAHHSADVWAHQDMFALDERGQPTHVSGVPPDAFSATGQRWGTPLFRWDALHADGYRWWIDRMRTALGRVDIVRLDHFVGFANYWEIPASAPDARTGRWVDGPGAALFEAIADALDRRSLPFIAEDLGCVSPPVDELRETLALPGMKVAQFGFTADGSASEHHPEHWPAHSVGYTGTHDNDTVRGWLASAPSTVRRAVLDTLHIDDERDAPWRLVELALHSRAHTVIVPMQDLLGLDSTARMNTPGRADGNWRWRLPEGFDAAALASTLRDATRAARRSP